MLDLSPEIEVLFNKVIKKHHKIDSISSSDNMVGNSLCIGNPGYGKTSSNRRDVEIRWAKGHKIFLLYDAGRMDLAYFMFPSNSDFWKKPKIEGKKIIGARNYPITLLYPVTRNIPKKLPFNGVPFTIGVNSLDENDYVALVGADKRDSIKSALYYMEEKIDDKTTPVDYLNILGNSIQKTKSTDKIKQTVWAAKTLKGDVFTPLINEGLLSSSIQETTLDLRELLKKDEKNMMYCLVLKHSPQYLWGFLVHYFLNHLFKILAGFDNENKIKRKTTAVLNEVADLLSADAETGSASEAISTMISKIAKQSRTSDMYMDVDTQLPQQLPDVKDTMQRIYVFNSGASEVSKAMEIIGISPRTGEITQDDLMLIPRLPRGYYYLFDKQYGVSLNKLVWTRSRTYLDGEDFYDIYNKVYGMASYVDISSKLLKLKEERESSEKLWKLRDDMEKEAKKLAEASKNNKNNKNKIKNEEDEVEEELIEEELEEENDEISEEINTEKENLRENKKESGKLKKRVEKIEKENTENAENTENINWDDASKILNNF